VHPALSEDVPEYPADSKVFRRSIPGFCVIFSPFPEEFKDISVSPAGNILQLVAPGEK